jgi:acyl-CoA synthetase (AMP-forming)/AMP-acid ligase II
MNAVTCLNLSAVKYPDKVGVICDDVPYTFGQVAQTALRLAAYLREKGVGRGDKVCTMFYNSIELVHAWFATLIIGGVNVPINFRFITPEVSYIANHSDAKAILHGREFIDVVDDVKNQAPNIEFSMGLDKGGEERDPTYNLPEVDQAFPIDEMGPKLSDPSFINYTSGTTGKPKGVVITHYNSIWNQTKIAMDTPIRHDDIMMAPIPLFHSGGMGRFLTTVLVGGTYITWKNFSAQGTMEAVERYKATFICLVPAMTRMIMALPGIEKYDVSSLRNVLLFAANVPVEMKKRALEIFYNAQIIDGYGLTENTSATTMLKGEDVVRKPASVGLPDVFTQVKIFDHEFEEVPPGVVGEIGISGPTVMKEYYKNPEATKATIINGWLMTGDLGRKDEEGYLYIAGRKKEMIISGGENIYPAEIESVLINHPKIRDTAIVGTPDPKWGETVVAFIALEDGQQMTEDEVEQYCIAHLARYKRPRMIRFVDSVLRNESGKVVKEKLKRAYDIP